MPLDDGGMGNWSPTPTCCLCDKYAPYIGISIDNARYLLCQPCFEELFPDGKTKIKTKFDEKWKKLKTAQHSN